MTAKMAVSAITVVAMPAAASDLAISWPVNCGALSQTSTSNARALRLVRLPAAAFMKNSMVRETP